MIKVPEIGQEGVCVQPGAKTLLAVLRSGFPNGGVREVEQACRKLCCGGVLGKPKLWRSSSGSQQAENIIKVPEIGQEGVVCKVARRHF